MAILRINANASIGDEGAWRSYDDSGPVFGGIAGVAVTNESALRLSAVYGCVKILQEAEAQLPLILYDRTEDDGKERSRDQLGYVLGHEPNDDQSRFQFIEQMAGWACFRSFAYGEVFRDRGRVEQIKPLDPNRLGRERLSNGRFRYKYRDPGESQARVILREEMFVLPGTPVLDYARDSFSIAAAVQMHAGRSFANGVRPSGFIATDPNVTWTEPARVQVKAAIESNHAGPSKAGGVLMLPEGLKWNQLGMTNEQAEYVASATFSVQDCARFFRIPGYMIGVTVAGAVSFASVEMQSIEFVIYTLMPWLRRWEGAIQKDLILRKESQFAEFLVDALLRGTTTDRYAAYAVGRQWGWLSVNDIRRLENLNPIQGGNTYLTPMNMTPAALKQLGLSAMGMPLDDGSPAARLARLFAQDTAGRMLRREVAAVGKLAERHDPGTPEFEAALDDFYRTHSAAVAQALHLPLGAALSYTRTQRDELLTEGPAALAAWEQDGKVDDLASLALAEAAS